jgi:hypothetical protein
MFHHLRRRQFPPGRAFFDFDEAYKTSLRLRTHVAEILLDPEMGVSRLECVDQVAVERLLMADDVGPRRTERIGLLISLVLAADLWTSP